MSDLTNQAMVDAVNQILAELRQAARDGALLENGYYNTEAEGRAAVANGDTFKVVGSGYIACSMYRRISASSSTLLFSISSAQFIESLSMAGTDNQLGLFFGDAYYERQYSNNNLYIKFGDDAAQAFYSRGVLGNFEISKSVLMTQLRNNPAAGAVFDATSPSGVPCDVMLAHRNSLIFNPVTKVMRVGSDMQSRTGEIMLVYNNDSVAGVGPCLFRDEIALKLFINNSRKQLVQLSPSEGGGSSVFANVIADFSGRKMIIPAGITAYDAQGGRVTLPAAEVAIPTAEEIGGTLNFLEFNVNTSTYGFVRYHNNVPGKNLRIAFVRDKGQVGNDFDGQAAYTSLGRCSSSMWFRPYASPKDIKATIIVGDRAQTDIRNWLPAFDITAEIVTFTLRYDTILEAAGRVRILSEAKSVSFPRSGGTDVSSTAIRIYYDRRNDELWATKYDFSWNPPTAKIYDSYLICTVRMSPSSRMQAVADLGVPYTVNGYIYGQWFTDLVAPTAPMVNPADAYIRGVAHRGLSNDYPENTLVAYRAAMRAGFTYVETDLQISSDGHFVLMHDSTVDRTTGGAYTGPVSSYTLAQLQQMDVGSWFDPQFASERVPSLVDFLTLCRRLNLRPYLECKFSATDVATLNALNAVVDAAGMRGRVTWLSSNSTVLARLSHSESRGGRLVMSGDITASVISSIQSAGIQGEVFIDTNRSGLTTDGMALAKAAGLEVEAWTITSEAQLIALVNMGVTGITTNFLNVIQVLSK